jgi:plasmid stabilization system protein ParE
MLKLKVSSYAKRDIQRIVNYYDKINPSLVDRFLEEIDDCFAKIENLPEGYQKRYKAFRIAFLKKFSFGLYYKIYNSEIVIAAVLHTSQRMDKWFSGR